MLKPQRAQCACLMCVKQQKGHVLMNTFHPTWKCFSWCTDICPPRLHPPFNKQHARSSCAAHNQLSCRRCLTSLQANQRLSQWDSTAANVHKRHNITNKHNLSHILMYFYWFHSPDVGDQLQGASLQSIRLHCQKSTQRCPLGNSFGIGLGSELGAPPRCQICRSPQRKIRRGSSLKVRVASATRRKKEHEIMIALTCSRGAAWSLRDPARK